VTLKVYRKGHPVDVTVKLGEAPINDQATRTASREVHAEERLGINVATLDDQLARQYGYDEAGGVIISDVARASPAARRGLAGFIGFKLVQVDDTPIRTPDDVRGALEKVKGGEIVSLHLEDPQGGARVMNVRMPN
jgi:S1-C subfamily serine protease